MKSKSTMLTIAVADGVKPFLVQVAAKEDREGLWNLSSILFPQIGVTIHANPDAVGTNITGETLAAIAEGQREFLDRTGAQRETWRKRKEDWKRNRNGNPKESPGIPENPQDSSGEAKPPRSSKPKKQENGHETAFAEFWAIWPRKVARKAAEKAWSKAWKDGKIDADKLPAILEAVRQNSASAQWSENGGQFIPHPATWINGERWNDSTGPVHSATIDPIQYL